MSATRRPMSVAATPDAPQPDELVLVSTKFRRPVADERLVVRPRLEAALDAASRRRLCLVSAPAGFGKTALVGAWSARDLPGRRVAWVALDDGDNDPFRFWTYLIEAICRLDPAAATELREHGAAGSEQVLLGVVLPRLLNVLDDVDFDLALVLDDVHLINDQVCHRTLAYFAEHLPPQVHLCLLTRVDPPLPLARLRVSGELYEIRGADLAFTLAETRDLLEGVLGLGLSPEQVEQLWRLTEGWPAAVYLAGLSIRSGAAADAFIASYESGHRHVFDYLGSEVLRQLPADRREFLTQTSILGRMCASLCDEVCGRDDSGRVIADLETDNLFLVPLDGRREWYRYHHLFAALLRLELQARAPDEVLELHRRAARWFERAGRVEDAIHHFVQAHEIESATRLIVAHWLTYDRSGQIGTVARWLEGIPESAIRADPELAVIAAWVDGKLGVSRVRIEQRLEAAQAAEAVPPSEGSFPIPFGVAVVRGINFFGDVGGALLAARAAVDAAEDARPWDVIAVVTLGRCLYFDGSTDEARRVLTESLHVLPSATDHPFCAVTAWSLLSLLDDEDGEHEAAAELAHEAFDLVQSRGIWFDPMSSAAHLACARAARRAGHLTEAHALLTEAVTVLQHDSYAVPRAEVLLELASVQQASGEPASARASVQRAASIVQSCADPGGLPARLAEVSDMVHRGIRPGPRDGEPLTRGEARVLRLLDTPLSQSEIAGELQLSVNTVRTHVRAVYRKLGVSSRDEAVRASRDERRRSGGRDGEAS